MKHNYRLIYANPQSPRTVYDGSSVKIYVDVRLDSICDYCDHEMSESTTFEVARYILGWDYEPEINYYCPGTGGKG